jgi:GNAT superfamily N-acetyltransferase
MGSYSNSTLDVAILDKSGKQVGHIDTIIDGNYLPCNDAYIVRGSFLNASLRGTGVGALLYDVAIENAGDSGLASDRNAVSTDAERMWQYFDRSPDYTSLPFDTPENEFTPDNYGDDCDAVPYQSYEGLYDDYGSKDQFQGSFLNKSFYKIDKSMATTNCLKEKGLLRFDKV